MTDPVDPIEQGLGYDTVPNPVDQASPTVDSPRSAKLLPPAPAETTLKKEAAINRLAATLPDLLFRWSPHPSQSDYECVFCGRRPASWKHDIEHQDDCLGVELLRAL